MTQNEVEAAAGADDPSNLQRHGKVSYLEVPALDPRRSAAFYECVFSWEISGLDSDEPHFQDTAGEIIGAWVTGRRVSGDAGVLPYIYVDRVDEALERVAAHGGKVIKPPSPEGDLWVATFRDPAGNVMGVWQRGPR